MQGDPGLNSLRPTWTTQDFTQTNKSVPHDLKFLILGFQIPQSTAQGFEEKETGPEKAKHLEPGRGKALKGPKDCCKLCGCYMVALRASTFLEAHAKAQKLSSLLGVGA